MIEKLTNPVKSITQLALILAILTSAPAAVAAESLMSAPYTDHAVFQRDREIVLHGRADPGERVTLDFDGESVRTRTNGDGAWLARLSPRPAGGPYELTARTDRGAQQTISDILVGDVYLCSGQSNMEFELRKASNADYLVESSTEGKIRLLHVPHATAFREPRALAAPDGWRVASPETAKDFSAVCFLFGKEISATANAPIGLIESSWGGTRIEAWMSRRALEKSGDFAGEFKAIELARSDPAGEGRRYSALLRTWWEQTEPGGKAGFARADFDDATWPQVNLGGPWESLGARALADFDGVVWFRKRFTLNDQEATGAVSIALGPIDDVDVAYVNGVLVGAGDVWDMPRDYKLPPGLLHAGENVIAVGVLDTGGGGGLWGARESRKIRFSNGSSAPLGEGWKFLVSAPLLELAPPHRVTYDGENMLSGLYNPMIAPLAPYGLRGVLWYQGEANAQYPDDYRRLLPEMIADWRRKFDMPQLPFIIVQLAAFGAPATSPQKFGWGAIREAQRQAARADANVGMATAIDIGDPFDIHPTQKHVLARRMALVARRMIYGENVVDQGPQIVSAASNGDGVIVAFDHGPLVTRSSNRPIAFELCTEARACRFVDATIMPGNRVRLDQAGHGAVFVRYCWGGAPLCNLFNAAGLPATPFEVEIR